MPPFRARSLGRLVNHLKFLLRAITQGDLLARNEKHCESHAVLRSSQSRRTVRPETGFGGSYQSGLDLARAQHADSTVFFVPRQEITLRDCTEEELQVIHQSAETFSREKAAFKLTTGYGLSYSPQYLRQSRSAKPSTIKDV